MALNSWTILALLTLRREDLINSLYEQHERDIFNYPAGLAMLMLVDHAASSASEIGDILSSLLMTGHRGPLLLDDDTFSLSQRLFWSINVIEDSKPMISHTIEA